MKGNAAVHSFTVDITPTWAGILPAMLAVLENEDAPSWSRQTIKEELQRMAAAADKYNELVENREGES